MIMNYYDFIKKIDKKDMDSVYLFIGDEEYLMNDLLMNLKSIYINDSFDYINFVKINERYGSFDSLKNACETLPFMSDKKIVLLKDVYRFVENQNFADEGSFYEYLDSLGEHIILILMDIDSKVKKNSRLYKFFKERNLVINFEKLKGANLNQWIVNIFKKSGKKISNANINYFIKQSSYLSRNISINLYVLENALNKLIDFSKGKEITKKDIDSILIRSIDTNIFELLNAINRFDAESALRELNEMYMSNEPIAKILYMIIRRIRLILSYNLYYEKGYIPRQIQDKLQIKDYEFRIIGGQIKNFNNEGLIDLMNKLLEIDIKIKTSSTDDKLLLEMFLVELCNK